jgi:hypothetical protein
MRATLDAATAPPSAPAPGPDPAAPEPDAEDEGQLGLF